MSNTQSTTGAAVDTEPQQPQARWSLLLSGVAFGVLMVASVVLMSGPLVTDGADAMLPYIRDNGDSTRLVALLQLASAIPLAIWTATVYRRLRNLGANGSGAVISLAGGLLASGSLLLLGTLTWTSAEIATTAAAQSVGTLAMLSFSLGSAAYVPAFALLVAGVAVPSLALKLLPKGVAWFGLVVATVGTLSILTMVVDALMPLLPIGRFGGLLFVLLVSALLPATVRAKKSA